MKKKYFLEKLMKYERSFDFSFLKSWHNNIVKEWYTQNAENNVQTLDQYFGDYEIVKSNNWIFNLLNNIDLKMKK